MRKDFFPQVVERGFRGLFVLVLYAGLVAGLTGCATLPADRPPAPVSASASKHVLFWDKDAGTPERRFELAKNSVPELTAFLVRMPKGADLHNHASGATYSEYILDSTEKRNQDPKNEKEFRYNLATDKFVEVPKGETGGDPDVVKIEDLKKNSSYLAQFANACSMRGWYPNTTSGHDHFFDTFTLIGSGGRTADEMLAEVAKRNIAQNVQYLELMVGSLPEEFTELFSGATGFDLKSPVDEKSLDKSFELAEKALADAPFDAKESIGKFLDDRERNLIASGVSMGQGKPIVVRYIQQLKRSTDDMAGFFFSAYAAIYGCLSDPRLVGVNMVQAEDSPFSRHSFDDQIAILDHLWRNMGEAGERPSFSIHAGELVLRDSPMELMRTRIGDTVRKGHALRIGHGVSIGWEEDLPELLAYMRDKRVLVEICLSSNESILGIEGSEHPFLLYRAAGVPTALCTDDEGVNRGNLTTEYVKAVMRYDLSYADVKELTRNSLEYSFLPGRSLYVNHDYSKIRSEFRGIELTGYEPSDAARKLLDENPKLERQYALERAWVLFEEELVNGFRRKSGRRSNGPESRISGKEQNRENAST